MISMLTYKMQWWIKCLLNPSLGLAIYFYKKNLKLFYSVANNMILNVVDTLNENQEIKRNELVSIVNGCIFENFIPIYCRQTYAEHKELIESTILEINSSFPNDKLRYLYNIFVLYPLKGQASRLNSLEINPLKIKKEDLTFSKYLKYYWEIKKIQKKELKTAKSILEHKYATTELPIKHSITFFSIFSLLIFTTSFCYAQYFFYLFDIDASQYFSLQDYPSAYGKKVFIFTIINTFSGSILGFFSTKKSKIISESGRGNLNQLLSKKIKLSIFLIILFFVYKLYNIMSIEKTTQPHIISDFICAVALFLITVLLATHLALFIGKHFKQSKLVSTGCSSIFFIIIYVILVATNDYNMIISEGINAKRCNFNFTESRINDTELVLIGNSSTHFIFYNPIKYKTVAINSRYIAKVSSDGQKKFTEINIHNELKKLAHSIFENEKNIDIANGKTIKNLPQHVSTIRNGNKM